MTADFWQSSGFPLVERDGTGRLVATDELLRAYIDRPELRPVDESCAAERALHARLLAEPGREIGVDELAAIADADVRENFAVLLGFRDHLRRHPSIESAYLALFRDHVGNVPALFVDQLAHLILRNMLDGASDPFRLRAAELLFRSQKVTLRDGAMLVADEETVEMHAKSGGFGQIGRLLVETQAPLRQVDLDVLDDSNASLYWQRSDRFDVVLDISFTRPGLDGLCRVLEAWIAHFLGVEASVQPVRKIRDERWRWHIGLDAGASRLLDDLYAGQDVDEDRLQRLLALFRLELRDSPIIAPDLAGRPVYLGMMMDDQSRLRLKPQNLLLNLPLVATA